MIKDLSTREKNMLYILAVFLLAFAAIYFIILPTAAHTADLRACIDKSRELAQTMEDAIKRADGLDAEISALRSDYASLCERQMPFTQNAGLDALFTGIIIHCGLEPLSLDFGALREDYVPARGEILQYGEQSAAPRTTFSTVNATFSGSLTGFARFIDAAGAIDSVRLASVSYSRPGESDSYTFSVGLTVYMDRE